MRGETRRRIRRVEEKGGEKGEEEGEKGAETSTYCHLQDHITTKTRGYGS